MRMETGGDLVGSLSADALGELGVLRHDRDAPCMDGRQVAVLKVVNYVGFCGLLQSLDGRCLEAQVDSARAIATARLRLDLVEGISRPAVERCVGLSLRLRLFCELVWAGSGRNVIRQWR